MNDLFITEYKKTIHQIRKEYPNFDKWSDSYMFSFYGKILEDQIIYEFITKTIGEDKTIEELKRRFDKKFLGVKDNGEGNIYISFRQEMNWEEIFPSHIKYIDEINQFMDSFGWFPASVNGKKYSEDNLDQIKSKSDVQIRYEPKFDAKIDPTSTPYYYHLVPDILWVDIETFGLTPKTKSKLSTHPERVYLVKEYNKEEFERLAKMLYSHLEYRPEVKDKIKNYYILEVDIKGLIESGRDKFYKDPNYSLGIWTYENIPPSYIKKIDEITVNNK